MNTMPKAFDCRMCGTCCRGSGGIVVSDKDLQRLCAHSALSPREFSERFTERRNGKLVIRAGDDGCCIFFTSTAGCTIHPAKPDICRAWPFFRGNLLDAESLALAKDYCPGINPDMEQPEFARCGLEQLEAENLVGRGGADEAAALQVKDLLTLLAKVDKSL